MSHYSYNNNNKNNPYSNNTNNSGNTRILLKYETPVAPLSSNKAEEDPTINRQDSSSNNSSINSNSNSNAEGNNNNNNSSTTPTSAKKPSILKISGFEIKFPDGKKPFPSQVAVINQTLSALNRKENALIESPTGILIAYLVAMTLFIYITLSSFIYVIFCICFI